MKRRRKEKKVHADTLLIFLSSLLILTAVVYTNQIKTKVVLPTFNYSLENLSNISYLSTLSTKGYTKVSISVDSIYFNYAKITLRSKCYILNAQTDPCVAYAIENGLKHKVYFRPTIYDVMNDLFKNFGIKVLMVKVNSIRNNTFIGSLYVQKGDKILSLDIRPSDATALALRSGAPVYMNTTLLKKYGRYIC